MQTNTGASTKNKTEIHAVIFDMDGTITVPTLDFERIRREMGISLEADNILSALEEMSEEDASRAMEVLYKHEKEAADNARLNDGAIELLEELKNRNLPTGLLTRNTQENVDIVCAKFNLEFDGVIDRNGGPIKPNPFGIITLCKQFNVEPANTMFVGDYYDDMICARDAGARAVLFKSHPRCGEFFEYCDIAIEKLTEIIKIIDETV